MTSDRKIRVYCPEHNVGFEAATDAPIHCNDKAENHLLAPKFPTADLWEYCCDCNTFCPFQLAKDDRRERNLSVEQCVVCKEPAIRRYLCDQCGVVSAESAKKDEKGEKSYRITTTGFIRPAKGQARKECPGCLQSTQATIHEHHCGNLELAFTTPRSECPFCHDEIQPPSNHSRGNGESLPQSDELSLVLDIGSDAGSDVENLPAEPLNDPVPWHKKLHPKLVILVRRRAVRYLLIVATIGSFLLATPIREKLYGFFVDHEPKIERIVFPGVLTSGNDVGLTAIASDPDGDQLTYEWGCTGAEMCE